MTMAQISRDSLLTLEAYSRQRKEFRARVIAHKKNRTLHLGEHMTLIFEDELTVRYQIQEMLRIEKTFEEDGIQRRARRLQPADPRRQQPQGHDDDRVRRSRRAQEELAKLRGVEDKVYVQVDGHAKVYAIADEDLERENDEKTSSVHFLRFEFAPEMIASFKGGRGRCHRHRPRQLRGARRRSRAGRPDRASARLRLKTSTPLRRRGASASSYFTAST